MTGTCRSTFKDYFVIAHFGKKFAMKAQQILDLAIRKRKLRKRRKKDIERNANCASAEKKGIERNANCSRAEKKGIVRNAICETCRLFCETPTSVHIPGCV